MFDFKHIQPFDKTMIYSSSPMVLFATPGMLHGGLSLAVFKEWCTDEKNLLIIPGYCSPGTMGDILLKGAKNIEIDGKFVQIKCEIVNMSFSAHADAQGLLKLIGQVKPENVVLVHGEKEKMHSFAEKIKEAVNLPVFVPENNKVTEIDVMIYQNIWVSAHIFNEITESANIIKTIGLMHDLIEFEKEIKLAKNEDLYIEKTEKKPINSLIRSSQKIEKITDIEKLIFEFKIKSLEYFYRFLILK